MSVRHEKDKGVNVQVLLRCRPFSEEELRSNAPQVVTCNDFQREVTVCQSIANKQIDRTFTFDKVFGPSAQQKDLYDQAVIPIVNEVLEGFNCTIFAYGQTGTGKTYTMEGESKKGKNAQTGELPTDAGVIPRAVKQIFDTLESQNAEYSVKVTFLELYNEEITDLLAPDDLSKAVLDDKQKKPLALMEDGKGGVLIRGLEEEIVTSANEIFTLLERGSAKRRTAETLLNKQSSRSHSLFSITIHIKEATPEGEELIKCGKLNLVDLAGSENISRSGARDGRAREAGEINKSLLTLGRVITALVEHLGHIPYRDSKLTRLLRDSLGGRTKTCIIATVSPSVHCLEETLSTLDYAHRAKNIKNKPEVNQKMMKSTLIKDLYGEIERLKLEVYAAREKSGVYIPKDRYYQEEAEKKAMADRIEQLEVTLETNNKRFEDLQEKYYAKQRHCNELTSNLDFTQRSLDNTKKSLASLNDNYKKAQFEIKERDYVIAKQKDSETALTNQACLLRADLEQSIQDVAGLFAKIERKEKVCNGNKQLVENFQSELAERIGVLCNTVIQSMAKQNQHLQSVEKQFSYCMDFKDKSSEDLKNKVNNLKMQYVSHLKGLQNIVRLHKASSDAVLDEVKSAASNNTIVLEQLFEQAVSEGDAVLKELQNSLLDQQSEIAEYAHQMRERARTGIEVATTISDATTKFFGELAEQTSKLQGLINHYHTDDEKSLIDFQREYEEQSKQEEEKLISEITSLVAKAMVRKSDLVNTRINNLKDSALQKRESLQSDVSTIETVTSDAKRKWEMFAKQAEEDANDNAAISAAKHCRMEVILQQCMSTTTNASQQWKSTKKTVEDIGKNHQQTIESLARDGEDANEKHIAEIEQARLSAETVVDKHSEDILLHVQSSLENEHKVASEIQSTIAAHSDTLNTFQKDHKDRVVEIEEHSEQCFRDDYVEDHPTSTTPTKKNVDIPTKDSIESLRAPAFDILVEEFRENNPHDSEVKELQENGVVKDTKPYQDSFNLRDSRTPLIQLNCDYYVDDININQH